MGRPRPFESREHAETVLSEIRAAVLAGQPLDRILDRMRGRTQAEDLVQTRLAAYVRDFALRPSEKFTEARNCTQPCPLASRLPAGRSLAQL